MVYQDLAGSRYDAFALLVFRNPIAKCSSSFFFINVVDARPSGNVVPLLDDTTNFLSQGCPLLRVFDELAKLGKRSHAIDPWQPFPKVCPVLVDE
jgi:hypothetical protein